MSLFDALKMNQDHLLGEHTFIAEDIKRFAALYDPQPFHLDEAEAEASIFGRLCASGWHTASVWMRKNVDFGLDGIARASGYDGPLPIGGPSPGVKRVSWLLPVYEGDTIRYYGSFTSKRPLNSKPGWGMVGHFSHGINQDGDRVIEIEGAFMLGLGPT
ncbi:MAG: MaoC/PaaZ C-terminal domain-containing protein [Pseudomonadota bacterium]